MIFELIGRKVSVDGDFELSHLLYLPLYLLAPLMAYVVHVAHILYVLVVLCRLLFLCSWESFAKLGAVCLRNERRFDAVALTDLDLGDVDTHGDEGSCLRV